MKFLVSAGEASGDLYTASLVSTLARRLPDASFHGCAGPRMRGAGVDAVVDAASLNVVGLVEVVSHLPRIYGEYRNLLDWARLHKPSAAILTDSPDFHLRLAAKLHALDIPVIYFIAPQVWAWRKSRVRQMRRHLAGLLCIFPFEPDFFKRHRMSATYIGHPLTRLVRPALSKEEFLRKHRIPASRPLVTLLPGSRPGEIARHLPVLADAASRMNVSQAATFLLATPAGLSARLGPEFFRQPISGSPIQHIEGETWDAIAHADLALAASGTVTIEAAILGTPMVTYYKVSPWSWWMGRFLVDVPFFSMVNLVAGRRVVPELIQNECSGESLASYAATLLADPGALSLMRADLAQVAAKLATSHDPMEMAADKVMNILQANSDKHVR
ncbi:MAG: lipid-A-disaccharide synthase [Acidimicrobiia bacterium]|nr:lipid-A-disaccharide synthase [Acidimicrobiia bacterium]